MTSVLLSAAALRLGWLLLSDPRDTSVKALSVLVVILVLVSLGWKVP